MTKKSMIIISTIIISTLIGLNIYMQAKSYKISQYVNESNTKAESIVLIDKFRVNINRMSQAQKLYLVTSKEDYRVEYEEYLQKIYSTISGLEELGAINGVERHRLIMAVDDYSNMDKDMMELKQGQTISLDMEEAIIKSNQAQLNILKQLDSSVDKNKENLIDKNNTFMSQMDIQKNFLQVFTTVTTAIGSIFLYYAKKNPFKLGEKIGGFIYCLINNQDSLSQIIKKDTVEIENEITKIEDEIIKIEKDTSESKKCMKDLMNHEKNLEGIKLINIEANNLKNKILEAEEIISRVDYQIKKLIINIEEIENCSTQIPEEQIRNIEEQIIELRILFEVLPIYSGIILDISTNIKSNNTVEKL